MKACNTMHLLCCQANPLSLPVFYRQGFINQLCFISVGPFPGDSSFSLRLTFLPSKTANICVRHAQCCPQGSLYGAQLQHSCHSTSTTLHSILTLFHMFCASQQNLIKSWSRRKSLRGDEPHFCFKNLDVNRYKCSKLSNRKNGINKIYKPKNQILKWNLR